MAMEYMSLTALAGVEGGAGGKSCCAKGVTGDMLVSRPLEFVLRSEGDADSFRSTIALAGVLGMSCSDITDEEPIEDVDSVRIVGVTGVRAPGGRRC